MPATRTNETTTTTAAVTGPTKGHACVRCKRLKMKCDGAKPACGSCLKLHKISHECRYEALVERSLVIKPVNRPAPSARVEEERPFTMPPEMAFLDHTIDWWKADEPPVPIRDFLIKTFITHAYQVHFDQLLPCFLHRLTNYPPSSPRYPHPALLNAIYLVAIFYLSSPRHPSRIQHRIRWNAFEAEMAYLMKTQGALPQSLGKPEHLFDYLLASTILSKYFFYSMRQMEGHAESTATMHFAMACNLHIISSPNESDDSFATSLLPYPTDVREIHDRINAFWCIFIMDRGGSSCTNLDIAIPDADVVTVFPHYKATCLPDASCNAGFQSVASLYNPNSRALDVRGEPIHVMMAKYAALLGKALCVTNAAAQQGTTDLQQTSVEYRLEFCTTEQALVKFIDAIPSTVPPPATPSEASLAELAALRSMARAALIRLHSPFEKCYEGSDQRLLRVAEEILENAKILEKRNEIFWPGGLHRAWICACDAFHKGIQRVLESKGPAELLTDAEKELVLGWLDDMRFMTRMLTRFANVYVAYYAYVTPLNRTIAEDALAIERWAPRDGWDIVTSAGPLQPPLPATDLCASVKRGEGLVVKLDRPITWVHYSQN